MRNTIDYFNKDKDDFIIAEWLFDERKLVILRQPFSLLQNGYLMNES